jgi:hypothetical protein
MPTFMLALIDADQLIHDLEQLYWDTRELSKNYRPKDRETNKRVLDDALDVISGHKPVASWPAAVCQRFVMTACALAREALLIGSGADPTRGGLLTPSQRANLLCSFASACPQLHLMGRLQASSVWVMTCLVAADPLADADGCLAEALQALVPLNLPPEEALDQVRAQIILHVGRLKETGQPLAAPIEQTARQWCADLFQRGKLVNILPRAARVLGVPLPERPTGAARYSLPEPGSALQPTDVAPVARVAPPRRPDAFEAPTIWRQPTPASPSEVQQEFLSCLLRLQATARVRGGPLSPRTAEGLNELGPRSDLETSGRALFFAARELWHSYGQTGNREHLELAQRTAQLAFRAAPNDGDRKERAGALYLWMNTQLPALVATHDLHNLLEDGHRLYGALGCKPGDRSLRQGLVEAHAGLCRERAAAHDLEGRERLLRDHGPALRRMHAEFLRQAAAHNFRPSEETLAAWDYLFPARGHSGGARPDECADSPLLANPTFRDVVRRGSPAEVCQFIQTHKDEFRNVLLRRLDVRLTPQDLFWPEGTVREPHGIDKKRVDPRFLEARSLLEQGDFEHAAAAFGSLAEQVEGRGGLNRPREICRNYEAYALAHLGESVQARAHLDELTGTDVPFASAYWNHACCIANTEPVSQLTVLLRGLDRAPHLACVRGVVSLALVLERKDSLRAWLPCLVETEALLLAYLLEFEELAPEDREPPVRRLARYVLNGAEPHVPDPTDRALRSAAVHDFMRHIFDLRLERVFEFWLRCREQDPAVRYRFDFWESKAEFLASTQRPAAAAEAFREEMRCRLNLLRNGRFLGPHVVQVTRQRLEHWLNQCMTPDLGGTGHDIYAMVEQFEQQNPDRPGLLPRVPRIHNYFSPAGSDHRPETREGP